MEKFDELRHCLQGLDKAMETKKKKKNFKYVYNKGRNRKKYSIW